MNDKELLKHLLTKYGKDEIIKMMNDISNRNYKFKTGTHSVRLKNDDKLFLIQHAGYDWQDFIKMWNKISNTTRNKIYIPNNDFDTFENKIKNNRWYILKSTEDPNYPYIIAIENEIEKR